MITSIPITDLRRNLNGVFLSDMITPVVITVTGFPARVIVDVPRTKSQLELIKQELDDLYDSLQRKRDAQPD